MARKAPKLARSARIACEKWRSYFKENINLYHEMHTFVLGQQWSDDEEDMLKTFRKVPLVSNKLATMANSLMGEQQQNTPQLQVVPMDNCDEETAHLRELITKDIMFSDHATTAYQVAAGQAFIGGYSAFCWDTEYTHPKSFDLDFVCHYFKDATRTYFDVGAETVNKTDGTHCGYISRMTRAKFKEVYGKDLEEKIAKTHNIVASEEEIALAVEPKEGDDPFSWADADAITILDHFVRKYEKDMLYKLSNGKILNQEEMDELIEKSQEINERNQMMLMQQAMMQEELSLSQDQTPDVTNPESLNVAPSSGPTSGPTSGPELSMQATMQPRENESDVSVQGESNQDVQPDNDMPSDGDDFMTLWDENEPVRIEDKREIKRHKIMRYKIAGDYILEDGEFPSDQLPLVFVDQNSYYDKNGKQRCRSFFGDCKDTQRYINYLRTQSAYILKISRYDQFIGSKKNVQGLDTQRNWQDPNNTQGLLAYDESPNGHKPEQIRPPELSQSLLTQYQLAVEDLYTSTGMYPTRMGQTGNEVSGSAINARTRQGSYSTFVAFNSINRAMATGGEVVNEMIPRVYDAQRVIALMTPDEGLKNITINKQTDDYDALIENDIRKGSYEVRLKPGPSYEGQKQQALESLQQVLQASPETFNLIADLYADNLPLMNNIEIKNRLKTMVPPAIIEAGKSGKMPQQNGAPSPEQMQMQMQEQAAQADMQFKQAQIQIKQRELQLKEKEMQAEIEIERMKLEISQIELAGNVEEQRMRYLAETDRTQSDNAISHADNLVKILTHKI